MTTKKPSPTATKKPTPQADDGATLADILAVLKGIDAKLGALVPKPLEKL